MVNILKLHEKFNLYLLDSELEIRSVEITDNERGAMKDFTTTSDIGITKVKPN